MNERNDESPSSGACVVRREPEQHEIATDRPFDVHGRLLLNAYGRECWEAGHAAATAALSQARAGLERALDHAVAVLEEDGCNCGDASDPPCALCEGQAALADAKGLPMPQPPMEARAGLEAENERLKDENQELLARVDEARRAAGPTGSTASGNEVSPTK